MAPQPKTSPSLLSVARLQPCAFSYQCCRERYYDKKIAEGKTKKEALRALKQRISDRSGDNSKSISPARESGPGGHPGTTLHIQRGRLCVLKTGSSDQSLPNPETTLRPKHTPVTRANPARPNITASTLLTQRGFVGRYWMHLSD